MAVADTADNQKVASVLGTGRVEIDLETARGLTAPTSMGMPPNAATTGVFDHVGIANWLIDAPLKYTERRWA